jgi:hypothetical protein
MALRWIGSPPTKAELRVLQNAARRGKLPKNGTVQRASRANVAPAAAEFERFHWGERPKRVVRARLPNYDRGLYELGKLRAVEYETTKGGERAVWVHKFSKPFPSLTATPNGRLGPIMGGGAFVTERGIEK